MTTTNKAVPLIAIMAIFAVVAALGMVPLGARAADHLDAPGLMSPGGDARLDINDLYVFEGADASNTVLALTVNPVATGDDRFATRKQGSYHIRIDQDGDAIEDVTYSIEFKDKKNVDGQWVRIRRATGKSAQALKPKGKVIGKGWTDTTIELKGGAGWAYAGLRSDPFFFALGGFLGNVEGEANGRSFNDGSESDFFESLNSLGIVIEVPDAWVGGDVGVWATTTGKSSGGRWQVDRIGRPAINTVVNSSGPVVGAPAGAKDAYNAGLPRNDVADFTAAVVDALLAYSALDPDGPYSVAEAETVAGLLLPDVLTYDTSTVAAGPLNGRQLADDVIDVELAIITGGDVLNVFPRDEFGGVNTDGVGPHTDYLMVFPYLGVPH